MRLKTLRFNGVKEEKREKRDELIWVSAFVWDVRGGRWMDCGYNEGTQDCHTWHSLG